MSKLLRHLLIAGAVGAAAFATTTHAADKVVKVGVLHSLSGTMAISETSLRDTLLVRLRRDQRQRRRHGLTRSSR